MSPGWGDPLLAFQENGMEPVEIDKVDQTLLGPHRLVLYAANQPEYRPLPTAVLPGISAPTISRWRLTPEEKARLVAGEDLYLEQLTFTDPLQPVRLHVGCPDYCPMDKPND